MQLVIKRTELPFAALRTINSLLAGIKGGAASRAARQLGIRALRGVPAVGVGKDYRLCRGGPLPHHRPLGSIAIITYDIASLPPKGGHAHISTKEPNGQRSPTKAR